MNLKAAFIFGLSVNKRIGQYQRDEADPISFTYAISNYSRNLSVTEDMVADGREFVFSKEEFNKLSLTYPKRGDVIIDPDMGALTISEIIEMVIMGELVGFRVRTS
jgi:hypothetical protein